LEAVALELVVITGTARGRRRRCVAAFGPELFVAQVLGIAVEMSSRVDFLLFERSHNAFGAQDCVLVVLVDDVVLGIWLIIDVIIWLYDVDVGAAVLSVAQSHFVVAVQERIASVYVVTIGQPLFLETFVLHGLLLLLS
jgi:hypothetical protein